MAWIAVLFAIGMGCVGTVERVCESDDNCAKTATPSVCLNKRCAPLVCSPDGLRPCYTGAAATKGVAGCREGVQLCIVRGTQWSGCYAQQLPTAEICDGVDNNCDGQIDEGLQCQCKAGERRPCYTEESSQLTAPPSPCRQGEQECLPQGTWGACLGQVTPQYQLRQRILAKQPEQQIKDALLRCDETDLDCDGRLDAQPQCICKDGEQRPCYSGPLNTEGKGVCKAGTQRCVQDEIGVWRWGFCESQRLPTSEAMAGCNGQDDDCDGQIDNQPGMNVPLFRACPGSDCKVQICKNKEWSLCETIEICANQRDDDCDGMVDEADCR